MSDQGITRADRPPATRAESTELLSPSEGQAVRYLLVEQPPGEVVGALYVGVDDPQLGFMPVNPWKASDNWLQNVAFAREQSPGDGRAAFEYWRDHGGNGVTTAIGPEGHAASAAALRALVRKAAGL